jgi:glycosyltransferase involved in cell wall biosynthesis
VVFQGDAEIAEMVETGDESALDGADCIILSRIHAEPQEEDPWARSRDEGAKIVYETDDDLTDGVRWLGEGRRVEDAVKWADAVTVSTPHLGKVMEQFGKPVYVLPNLIHTNWYEQQALKADRQLPGITVGLVGTRSHFFDWLIVVDALKEISAKFPQVSIVVGGYPAPFLHQIPNVHYIRPAPFPHYPMMLSQLDIRLCPIDTNDEFNKSKSGIAVLEAMAATRHLKGKHLGGCIPIATNCEQYQKKFHEDEGLLVENTTAEWVEAIESFLPYGKRFRAQKSCRETVRQFDVTRGAVERERVYQEISDGEARGSKEQRAQ